MLRSVVFAGTQNADAMKHLTHRQLDVVVDSARLFDRSVYQLTAHQVKG